MKPFVFGKVMLVLESLVTVRTFIRTKICKGIISGIYRFIYIAWKQEKYYVFLLMADNIISYPSAHIYVL